MKTNKQIPLRGCMASAAGLCVGHSVPMGHRALCPCGCWVPTEWLSHCSSPGVGSELSPWLCVLTAPLCLPDGHAAAARGLSHALRQLGSNSRKSTALPCTCEHSDGLSAFPGRHIRSFSCWRLTGSSSQLFPLLGSYLAPCTIQGGG